MMVIDGVEMVDVKEAARIAGRTPETIRRWVWSRRLDAVKHGNRLLVRRDELAALTGAGSSGAAAMSLREWADQVRKSGSHGEPGTTASELVLADRHLRDEAASRAGG